jgi:hypothetical protein
VNRSRDKTSGSADYLSGQHFVTDTDTSRSRRTNVLTEWNDHLSGQSSALNGTPFGIMLHIMGMSSTLEGTVGQLDTSRED